MSHKGSYFEALADDVIQNIQNREALINRLEKLHEESLVSRNSRVQRLLFGIHNASLAVVETITAWNWSKQNNWRRQKNRKNTFVPDLPSADDDAREVDAIEALYQPHPFNVFLWNGENYLQKMLSDLDFVRDIPEAFSFLGSDSSFHRNPLLLPLGVDELVSFIPSDETQRLLAAKMRSHPWKDMDIERIRYAAFVILLDEYHRRKSSLHVLASIEEGGNDIIYPSCLRRDAIYSAKFYPPELNMEELVQYSSMIDPPAPAVIAVCCAQLILNSVGADVTSKLVY